MELLAVIEDTAVTQRILAHLGLPTRAPPRGPPWRAQLELALGDPAAALDGADPPPCAE